MPAATATVPLSRDKPATPLRYPGGKQKLTEFLRRCIIATGTSDVTYIEPYAGGAGAALALLVAGDVSRLVINDLDPAIHAFWHSAVHQSAALIKMVKQVEVTVDEWLKQREIYRAADSGDMLALGFATLFLNRTSRSGVLGGGVIGGLNQLSRYKVGARFYRDTLESRLSAIADMSDRITVRNQDGISIVREFAADPHGFFYVDPPYYLKGSSLYLNAFKGQDHELLANCLNAFSDARWLLTYDDDVHIVNLYAARRMTRYALRYSAHTAATAKELLISSDRVATPGITLGVANECR